jgi:hypothetical protein
LGKLGEGIGGPCEGKKEVFKEINSRLLKESFGKESKNSESLQFNCEKLPREIKA